MKKVMGFGEFMLSLNPAGVLRFIQADQFCVSYTGAEANVMASLSYLGIDTEYITKLPDHDIAKAGIAYLKKYGVGVKHIVTGGDRMGVLYLEKGASQRPSKVIYDRKYSAISQAQPDEFDWDNILSDACWFHTTGITPALSRNCAAAALTAVKTAKAKGLTVSLDLNYRKNLWSTAEARETMEKFMPYIDLLIANEEDAAKVLGIHAKDTDVTSGRLNYEGYVNVARQIERAYGIKAVAVTLRTSLSASDNEWAGMLYTGGEAYFSRNYRIHIVNRVGGGDSFAAGLIYADLNSFEPQKAIEFAAAASCLKHTIELDFNFSTLQEIMSLVNGDGSGRVQR